MKGNQVMYLVFEFVYITHNFLFDFFGYFWDFCILLTLMVYRHRYEEGFQMPTTLLVETLSFSDISILMSLSLSCLSSSNHLHLRLDIFFLFPYRVLSKPKYPRTVSAASSIISLYFSLSYSRFSFFSLIEPIDVTLQRGFLCSESVYMYLIVSPLDGCISSLLN